jgi:hypothetical protein
MDDDIEAVIKAAQEIRNEEGHHKPFLNPVSDLPSSKIRLKLAIKERIRLLYAEYISLATFVPKEDAMLFWEDGAGQKKQKVIKRVLRAMDKNRREIKEFDPFG